MKTAKTRAKVSLVDRLTIDKEIYLYSLFSETMPVIPYSEYIIQKVKNKLSSSYIGVHWRLEQSKPELLPECVQGLIKELNKVIKKEELRIFIWPQIIVCRQVVHYHDDHFQ
jgi:hypothetical protein